jgi:hypothetical protein
LEAMGKVNVVWIVYKFQIYRLSPFHTELVSRHAQFELAALEESSGILLKGDIHQSLNSMKREGF